MFFLKKNKRKWELPIVMQAILQLPDEYLSLKNQIQSGLIKRQIFEIGDIPDYVGFSYNSEIYDDFFIPNAKAFWIRNITLQFEKEPVTHELSVFVSYGLASGYILSPVPHSNRKIRKISIAGIREEKLVNNYFESIKGLFSEDELILLNEADIYEVKINGTSYIHISSSDDGNIYAINSDKKVFLLTHDPPSTLLIENDLLKFLQK